MAFKEIKRLNNSIGGYISTILADTITDIADVPTDIAVGSIIICLENKKEYVLSVGKVWTEQ